MSDWGWTTSVGNVGELPVRMGPDGGTEFLLDVEEAFDIEVREVLTGEGLRPGDVCILTGEVVSVEEGSPPTVGVSVLQVEYLSRAPEDGETVAEMMQHLEVAKETRRAAREANTCPNCREIDHATRLSVETTLRGRELHYCADCERLLSTNEYRLWLDCRGR